MFPVYLNTWVFKHEQRCHFTYSEHPCSIFHFVRVGLHVSVVKCAALMQVYLMVIDEMRHQKWNITCDQTLWTSIWTVVWSEPAKLLMLEFVLVWVNLRASHTLVFAWKLKLFCHLLKSQAPDVSQFLATSWAMVLYPMLATRADCVAIWALQKEQGTPRLLTFSFPEFVSVQLKLSFKLHDINPHVT